MAGSKLLKILGLGALGYGAWYAYQVSFRSVAGEIQPPQINTPLITIEELGTVGSTGYQYSTKRGIRNNNPSNIRHGDNWQGMAANQTDPSFVVFVKPEWGIRAMVKIFRSYARRGINTLGGIIQTWAPPNENKTDDYVAHVAQKLGADPWTVIDEHLYPGLIKAIIYHENGEQPYPESIIQLGISLAQ